MFDPAKAEPIFLEIVKRMPSEAVAVLGQAIREAIDGNLVQARATVATGRQNLSLTDPIQKPLAALQQSIQVHARLRELGATIPIDRIWARPQPQSDAPGSETTVFHDTQKAMLDEVRHQIAQRATGAAVCPGCGEKDAAQIGRAKLVHPDDGQSSQDQKCRALTRYLDPKPLVDALHNDISNTTADTRTTLQIMLMLAAREGLSVPVARCSKCALTFVAYRFREPDALDSPGSGPAGAGYEGGVGMTFLSAFEQVLLPHLAWSRSELWTGAAVYEFGCGSGASLAHHAATGMRAQGFEDDSSSAAYAREVFGLNAVSGDRAELEAAPAESATCVTCDLGLDRTPELGRVIESLCRMVAKNGYLMIVARNGETLGQSDTVSGGTLPILGGRTLQVLTPRYLDQQLGNRGLKVVATLRGPSRLEDPQFPIAQRDPFTGVPLWSARSGDFVVIAKRP
ncbi:MAG: methyltransferase domain-containing protein [Thalassobaculaceae bacterium]|nr:methyltransferase domain-containing protein [Thalassobaculaceae bacterium]